MVDVSVSEFVALVAVLGDAALQACASCALTKLEETKHVKKESNKERSIKHFAMMQLMLLLCFCFDFRSTQ